MVSNTVYRLVLFADYSNIVYSTENINSLNRMFSEEYRYFPLKEILADGSPYNGIMLSGEVNLPIVKISSQRIDVVFGSDRLEGFDEEKQKNVKKIMVETLKKVYDTFDKVLQDGNRISWISSYVYFDQSEEEKNAFKRRFLRELECYNDISTSEFVARYAGLDHRVVLDADEEINIVSTIKRRFPFGDEGFAAKVDGYDLDIDINTVVKNKRNRFSKNTFELFVDEVDEIQKKIAGEIFYECN